MADTPASNASRTLVEVQETPFGDSVIRDVNSVQEYVDPGLNLNSRPSSGKLEDEFPRSVTGTLSCEHHRHELEENKKGEDDLKMEKRASAGSASGEREILYIDWEEGDPRNPANFPRTRKWAITCVSSGLSGLVAAAASSYALGYASMTRDLNCTEYQATVGLSVYALGFGLFPMVLAPLSEEFGRQPIYIATTFVLLLTHLGVALAKNIQTVIILRFIAGAAASTGSTMVGGTVADIWAPHERGVPMSVFSLVAMSSPGLGPVGAGWIAMDKNLEWRWIQWIHMMATGGLLLAIIFIMKETRSSVLLTRLAKKLRKETGDLRYRARIEDERGSLLSLMKISCIRPIHLLLTEPVVASFSLWIGFAWGILFVLIESIAPAFEQLHHFNLGQVGTVFVTMPVGSLLGCLTNAFYQEKIYAERFKVRGHEARLYSSCAAGVLFPVSMFIYAWTSMEQVHWIGMCIGIILFIWAVYTIFLAVFTYLADCYGPYASSALAGQSLSRNLGGTVFPLFTTQMYGALTFKWANTVFACIAVLLMPIPFILFHWGPQIRARSKFASQVPAFGS